MASWRVIHLRAGAAEMSFGAWGLRAALVFAPGPVKAEVGIVLGQACYGVPVGE